MRFSKLTTLFRFRQQKPSSSAAQRRPEVGTATSIMLSHFEQAAQKNLTKSVQDRYNELVKSIEGKMREVPELERLGVDEVAEAMVRATLNMDVGDLWQSTKQSALAGMVTFETVLSRNEKVAIEFAHQLTGYVQWDNLLFAYFQ